MKREDTAGTVSTIISRSGAFPNNGSLSLIVYRASDVNTDSIDPAYYERRYAKNGWGGGWRNGVYDYHHYHSTAHEALSCYRGSAKIQFGGDGGPIHKLKPGWAVVIPAGVAHKRIEASGDFAVTAAYPAGQTPDMCYGGEGKSAERAINELPLPSTDPIFGNEGPLTRKWHDVLA